MIFQVSYNNEILKQFSFDALSKKCSIGEIVGSLFTCAKCAEFTYSMLDPFFN